MPKCDIYATLLPHTKKIYIRQEHYPILGAYIHIEPFGPVPSIGLLGNNSISIPLSIILVYTFVTLPLSTTVNLATYHA